MPLVRIITHSVEVAEPVIKQLKARGYAVETRLPGEPCDKPADFEIVLEKLSSEKALSRAINLSRTSDANVYIGSGTFRARRVDLPAPRQQVPASLPVPSIEDTVNGVAAGLQNKRDLLAKAIWEQRANMREARRLQRERVRQEQARIAADADHLRAEEAERPRAESAAEAERERVAAEAERQRVAEIERQQVAAAELERQRIIAAETAERQRVAAAEAERERTAEIVAREQAERAERLERDRAQVLAREEAERAEREHAERVARESAERAERERIAAQQAEAERQAQWAAQQHAIQAANSIEQEHAQAPVERPQEFQTVPVARAEVVLAEDFSHRPRARSAPPKREARLRPVRSRARDWRAALIVSSIFALLLMLAWRTVTRGPMSPLPAAVTNQPNLEQEVPFGGVTLSPPGSGVSGALAPAAHTGNKALLPIPADIHNSTHPSPTPGDSSASARQRAAAKPSKPSAAQAGGTKRSISRSKPKRASDDVVAEDEVIIRHFTPKPTVAAPSSSQKASLKRYSDLEE